MRPPIQCRLQINHNSGSFLSAKRRMKKISFHIIASKNESVVKGEYYNYV